jgi:hypothetical protein
VGGAGVILLTGTHGCKASTVVALYGISLSSFIAVADDNFEMLMSCQGISLISEVCVLT